MKVIIFMIVLFMGQKTFAWEALEIWNETLQQEIVMNCSPGENFCTDTCGEENQCRKTSDFCKNCVGSGILLSHFYQNVGSWYVNSGDEITDEDFVNILRNKSLMALTSTSPFNIFSPIGDLHMERAFNKLCPGLLDPYPVVLAELSPSGLLRSPSLVICHGEEGAKSFLLRKIPPAEVNRNLELVFRMKPTPSPHLTLLR
jgi:hypothetical protein